MLFPVDPGDNVTVSCAVTIWRTPQSGNRISGRLCINKTAEWTSEGVQIRTICVTHDALPHNCKEEVWITRESLDIKAPMTVAR